MAYNYEYPYTDSSLHNMDWILNKLKSVDDILAEAQQLLDEVKGYIAESKAYTDAECAKLQVKIDEANQSIDATNTRIDEVRVEINSKYEELAALIATNYTALDTKIDDAELTFDIKLQNQWEDTLRAISHAADNITVRNFFTGQIVSIQSMFDYMAQFHLTNATNYNGVTGHRTYEYLQGLGKDYTFAEMNSATMFI